MSHGLATLIVGTDGNVDLVRWPHPTWKQEDMRKKVVSARQNGVPIVIDGRPAVLFDLVAKKKLLEFLANLDRAHMAPYS